MGVTRTRPSTSLAIVSGNHPYKLVSVIYDHDGIGHFSAQSIFRGCWLYYDDLCGDTKPTHCHDFDTSPGNGMAGKPCMFIYVRDYEAEDLDFDVDSYLCVPPHLFKDTSDEKKSRPDVKTRCEVRAGCCCVNLD